MYNYSVCYRVFWSDENRSNAMFSGVARDFQVMGGFPAKLFWRVEAMDNWKPVGIQFFGTYYLHKTDVYSRETRHSYLGAKYHGTVIIVSSVV